MNSSYQCLGERNFLISLHTDYEMAKMEWACLPFRRALGVQGRERWEPGAVPEAPLIPAARQPGQWFTFHFLLRKPSGREGKRVAKAQPYPKRVGIASAPGKMAVV